MQTSWVAGLADGLYLLYRRDVQIGSPAASGEMTGFFAAKYAAKPVVPTTEEYTAFEMRPMIAENERNRLVDEGGLDE